jgi:hypothetical protein
MTFIRIFLCCGVKSRQQQEQKNKKCMKIYHVTPKASKVQKYVEKILPSCFSTMNIKLFVIV